jgi:hypothetical protein
MSERRGQSAFINVSAFIQSFAASRCMLPGWITRMYSWLKTVLATVG